MPSTPARKRQRPGETPEKDGGVIAIRQAVEHAGGSLRPAIAGIGTKPGKGNDLQPAKFLRRGLNEQSDFPMTGMITEGNRFAVWGAQSALRAENQELFPPRLGRVPAHAGVLRHPKQIAAGTVPEHFFGNRQAPAGPWAWV